MTEHGLRGKRVTVLGLGLFGGGVETALWALRRGARVTVTDLKGPEDLASSVDALSGLPVRLVLGEHREEDVLGADLVVVSPAVPREAPLVRAAREEGVALATEITLFLARCRAPVLAVTGSNGKTTTTSLLGNIVRASGRRTWIGGNIGRPLLGLAEGIAPEDLVVLEISSFQLEWTGEVGWAPRAGLVLNVTPNHLDRHRTAEAYEAAKRELLAHQTEDQDAVLVLDDPGSMAMRDAGRARRAYVSVREPVERGVHQDGDRLVETGLGRDGPLVDVASIPLRGAVNRINVAAAAAMARVAGVGPEAVAEGVRTFRAVRHRLEEIDRVDDVAFYDDSSSTTPESTLAALTAFEEPLVAILGGYDKGLPLDDLARATARACAGVVLIGATAPRLGARIEDAAPRGPVTGAADMDEAVRRAFDLAPQGGVVLLSPSHASYDMYRNYEERGEAFAEAIRRLRSLRGDGTIAARHGD
jgi:UDP-N-acetylmuramoylalanine--D-glutamate ligase